jgi:hypothetical protein
MAFSIRSRLSITRESHPQHSTLIKASLMVASHIKTFGDQKTKNIPVPGVSTVPMPHQGAYMHDPSRFGIGTGQLASKSPKVPVPTVPTSIPMRSCAVMNFDDQVGIVILSAARDNRLARFQSTYRSCLLKIIIALGEQERTLSKYLSQVPKG